MRIGIPIQDLWQTVGVKSNYLQFIKDCRHTPVIINPLENIPSVDGFLLPGGADVDSKRYAPLLPRWGCSPPDMYLEYFDTKVLPKYIRKDFPIFGVCRGLQTLNVHFGGSLYRDIAKFHPFYSKTDYDRVHTVAIVGEKNTAYPVNSFHHQAIQKLADDLIPVAYSEDGLIEAFRHKEFPIFAVQWHPEKDLGDVWSFKKAQEIFS